MKKNSVAKWVAASVGFTAVAAFAAGVIYQINAIKKLSVNIDEEEEAPVENVEQDAAVTEIAEEAIEEIAAEAVAEDAAQA